MNFSEFYKKFIISEEISHIDYDRAYELFAKEYLAATGKTWDKAKFLSRASNWTFYGDENGYVAIRIQNSGFYKLVGAAGSDKSKYKGIKELISMGVPLWGMVSDDLRPLLLKLGFKEPNFIERQVLKKAITGNNIVGSGDVIFNNDGSVNIKYDDLGDTKKYFLGSPAYWKKLYSMKSLMNSYK